MKKARQIAWFATIGCLVLFTSQAAACPMCSSALAEGQNQALPGAFYYSILFMLSMPFLLLGAFGAAFYRLSRMDVPQSQAGVDSPNADASAG